MLVILGTIIGLGCIFGGYVLHGGNLLAIWVPTEYLMIIGGATGAFIISNTGPMMKKVKVAFLALFKKSSINKDYYMSLMSLQYELLSKIRKEGLMSIEDEIENPDDSELFQKYPEVLADHHIIEFLTDYLRLMVSGNLNPMEIENLMDSELDAHHAEAHAPQTSVQQMADGLPAFGIVAAVMGVVNVMNSVGKVSNQQLGVMIASALVGTFLGILLAYALVGPVANQMLLKIDESSKPFEVVKTTLLASLNGYSPAISVEFGRKVLYSSERPTFLELEEHVKNAKSSGG